MKLYICNKKAIEQIIKDFPDEEMERWTKSEKIEYLANIYIHDYITMMFTNGKDYFRK